MLQRLRACDPGQPLSQVLLYRLCYWAFMIAFTLVYRVRFLHAERVPGAGGLLVICNHQSHLDPPLVGLGLRHRNMAPLARSGLFKVPLLGWWMRAVGCICLKENESDTAAMRRAIAELQKGRVVVIFPEGSRSPDGRIHEFKRGAWLLLSRAECDVLPAAVEGAFTALPRSRTFPRLVGQRCGVAYGDPIRAADLAKMGPEQGLAYLRGRVEWLRAELNERVPGLAR